MSKKTSTRLQIYLDSRSARDLDDVTEALGTSTKETFQTALSLLQFLVEESRRGSEFYVRRLAEDPTRVLMPALERVRRDAVLNRKNDSLGVSYEE